MMVLSPIVIVAGPGEVRVWRRENLGGAVMGRAGRGVSFCLVGECCGMGREGGGGGEERRGGDLW